MFFIRARHWWLYKIPPPMMVLWLLLAGRTEAINVAVGLALLVAIISFVCNFGYVLNELCDVEEDARRKKENVATTRGVPTLIVIAGICVICALGLSFFFIGKGAGVATAIVLALPLAYSVPPIRLKERKWLGVLSDALAAHVYPVVLCFVIASFHAPEAMSAMAVVPALLWAFTFGLRGILAHQLLDADSDRQGGLATVVHDFGRSKLISGILYGLVPIEILSLLALFAVLAVKPVFIAVVVIYAVHEALKLWQRWTIMLFSREERSYLSVSDNSFYEVWGPLAAALYAAVMDIWLAPLVPAFVAMFWERLSNEWLKVRRLWRNAANDLRQHRR